MIFSSSNRACNSASISGGRTGCNCGRRPWPCTAPDRRFSTSRSGSLPSAGANATPMLTVAPIGCSLNRIGAVTAEVRRRAKSSACSLPVIPVWTTTNSSPPSRATTSSTRMTARRRSATDLSRKSPPSCPSVSLISLKRSISMKCTANAAAPHRQRRQAPPAIFRTDGRDSPDRSAHRDAPESGCAGPPAASPWSGGTRRWPEPRTTGRSAHRVIKPLSKTSGRKGHDFQSRQHKLPRSPRHGCRQ